MYSTTSNLDTLVRTNPYVWDIRSPGKSQAEQVRIGRRPMFASRRSSRHGVQTLLGPATEAVGSKYESHETSIATLAQMGTALARLSDAALENKQNRMAAYASCGFAFPNACADQLAYGAELKRRELQRTRDRAFMAPQTETSMFSPLVE